MQRRQFLKNTSAALAATLAGCGGGDGDVSAQGNPAPPATAPSPAPGAGPSFNGLPTLTLNPTQTGTGPYMAAVYPLQGLVPTGQSLDSPDDPSFRSTVISRWPDGSASVVVVAGETGVTLGASKQIRLRAAAAGPSGLTAARVGQLVTDVTVDCGALGSATFTDFTAPSKVWWANERVICARYRKPVGTHTTLEAVIDIHAFSSNRALVEVVVENCKMATATPVAPAAASYTAAVTVNGAPSRPCSQLTGRAEVTRHSVHGMHRAGSGAIQASTSRTTRVQCRRIRFSSASGNRAEAWRNTRRMRIDPGVSVVTRRATWELAATRRKLVHCRNGKRDICRPATTRLDAR